MTGPAAAETAERPESWEAETALFGHEVSHAAAMAAIGAAGGALLGLLIA